MKTLQLYREGQEIMASDGIMYTEMKSKVGIAQDVRERNKSFEKNFPHKVADEFAIYRDRVGSKLYNRTKL